MEDRVYRDPTFFCRDPVICHLAVCFTHCGGYLINLQRSFYSLLLLSVKIRRLTACPCQQKEKNLSLGSFRIETLVGLIVLAAGLQQWNKMSVLQSFLSCALNESVGY